MGKDTPWWAKILLILVVFSFSILLTIMLEKRDIVFTAIAFCIVILSALVGALVARFSANQQFIIAEADIEKKSKYIQQKINEIGDVIKEIRNEAKNVIKNSDNCKSCINSLGLLAQTLKQVIDGKFGESLITYEGLIEIERNVKSGGEIWVLTSALELEDRELNEIIKKNFDKGISYTYLIPDNDEILHKKMIRLAKKWQKESNLSETEASQRIKCILVPSHFAYMTVIVYGPDEDIPTVLVKFPMSQFYEKEKYPLIYRVDTKPRQAWKTFVDSLQDLISQKRKCSFAETLEIDFLSCDKKATEKVN